MEYRREIDGLRALAVLPVILFHAGFETFSGGFVGVDVFFVISGYLITTILLAELEQGRFSIVNFYERRARRILPALFLVMFVCIPFAWFWLLPSDMKDFSQSLVAVSVFASNILFWHESGYFDTAAELKPLLHIWSLAVEEQYYVLFPLFLMLTWRLGKRWILASLAVIGILSLSVAQWGSLAKPAATFYLLPTRGWELLIGAFAAFYLSKENRANISNGIREAGSALGLALILYSVFAYDRQTPFPGFYALAPTIGTVLIILFSMQETRVGKFIGNKFFVGIGLISYSAYLWHQPLFAFARAQTISEPSKAIFLVLSIVAVGFAYLSWKYVESPFRDKQKFNRISIFSLSAAASSFFVLFGLIGNFTEGYESRVSERIKSIEQALNDNNPRQKECLYSGERFPIPDDSCILGRSDNVVGALIGDSHADALSLALEELFAERNLGLLSLTYTGCPPVRGAYRVDVQTSHKCYEYNEQSYKYLLENKKIKYVILSSRWTLYFERSRFDNKEGGVEAGEDAYIDLAEEYGIRTTHSENIRKNIVKKLYVESVEKLLANGKTVILIYPIPEVGFDVPKYKVKLDSTVSTSYDVFKERNKEVIQTFDSIPYRKNLIRIRPDLILCNSFIKGRCVTEVDGKIFYYDDNHLTNTGARIAMKEITKYISNE